jgi:putative copper export protein/mono/diheme cytochrome c family protein
MGSLEIVVVLLRGVHLAALLSLFGALLFLAVVAPAATTAGNTQAIRARLLLLRLARGSAALSLLAGVAWLTAASAVIAGTRGIAMALHALPVVALQTQFGQWVLPRLGLLIAVLVLPLAKRLPRAGAIVLAGAAVAVQPLIGHAGAIGGSLGAELIASEALHLLAAGAWLGGLLPLFIAIRILPVQAAVATCRSFTPIGLSAVVVLAGTAVVQLAEFIGGVPGLFGTVYGHIALVKVGLFLLLLLLAALNRFVLTEQIDGAAPAIARRRMRCSIAVETVLGALVVFAAGFLASSTPGVHEQPVWPFAWRPSLDAFADPDLRRELIFALLAIVAAIVVAATGLIWRQARWPALALSVIILAVAVPHLDLLFVAAYPTSFFTSPTEFAATAIVHGAKLFAANCVICHGAEGRGDGPAARSLPLRPADLTAEHFWAHSDGELYWYISHGFRAEDGAVAMPGYAGVLSSGARWDLIDYMRARNAGESMRKSGQWLHPLPVPQFDAECADGRTIDLDDLHGRVLHIIAASGDELAEPASPADVDATTIVVVRRRSATPSRSWCIASEPETWTALAIILGQSPDALAGSQILVDQNAWLRAAWRPGDPGDWTRPQSLTTAIRDIAAHPIAYDATAGHAHRH